MFSRSLFHHRPSVIVRAIALCALLLVIALAATIAVTSRGAARARQLSFEDRVAAQRAIEAVYHRHRIWPTDNPRPKPALDEVLPEAALRAKIADYLRQSRALELWRARAITADELQAEMERMARQTRASAVLDELWVALGRDPFVIAECLARPLLAGRELGQWFEDGGWQASLASQLIYHRRSTTKPPSMTIPQSAADKPLFDEWWGEVRGEIALVVIAPAFEYRLPKLKTVTAGFGAEPNSDVPSPRSGHTAVWTGSEMIVWGGSLTNTGGRYNPALDSWTVTNTMGAPSARSSHTAVWTGSEMIVWGSSSTNTGGRYNPALDSWTATDDTNAPSVRYNHTAVWTGSEMIIWGGDGNTTFNTGGRYNPASNSWTVTNATNTAAARRNHTAVWTGSEMIVWGGWDGRFAVNSFRTGGRYNPNTDSWTTTSSTGAPFERYDHTAVWAGSEMIIWGGALLPTSTQEGDTTL